MIYMDYNATTPIDKEVGNVMLPFIFEKFGNPSSTHSFGIEAKAAVEKARAQVANLLGAKPSEIIFTSGGSESNNMVIKSVANIFRNKGNHIITSQIEHPAILNPCKFLEKNGYNITYIPVDQYGIVSPKDIEKAITDKTILITIMHANNETGSIQPISDISKICRKKNILFHTDAAQSVGKIPTRVNDMGVDFLSLAGHKLYAPKGIGALYIKEGTLIEPLIHGAGHESGRRAGTENVIFDVGLGHACSLADKLMTDDTIRRLTEKLYQGMQDIFGERIRLNGHPVNRLPNTLYISFLGYDTTAVFDKLKDIAVSTGSACHSGSPTISSVLKAMGINEKSTSIRFSLGRFTTENDIKIVLERLKYLVRGN